MPKKPVAGKRPLLDKPKPLKLRKATPKKRVKKGVVAAFISKTANPVIFNPDNPNHVNPGKNFRFNPHKPPGLSAFSIQADHTEKLPVRTVVLEKPISRSNMLAGNSYVKPVDSVSREIQTDAVSHHVDAVMQTDNLIPFPAASTKVSKGITKKGLKKGIKKAMHLVSDGMDIDEPLPAYSGASIVTPVSQPTSNMPGSFPRNLDPPGYSTGRYNVPIPGFENRFATLRKGKGKEVPSVLGKRPRVMLDVPNKKARTDDKPGGTLILKRKRAASPNVANKKWIQDKTVLGKRGRGLAQAKATSIKRRKVDRTPVTVTGKRKRADNAGSVLKKIRL